MKKQNRTLITAASLAAAALSLSSLASGQTQASAGAGYNQPFNADASPQRDRSAATGAMRNDTSDTIRIASKDEAKRTAQKLAGGKVHGSDGKEVGTLKDFLVDPQSGEIRFAVISSGGFMGMGDKLRLVPFTSLQRDADGKRFTLSLSQEQLAQAKLVQEEQFEENRIPNEASSSVAANDHATAGSATLMRATKIHGRDVKANGDKIGSIDALVIEDGSSTAVALLDPAHDVGASGQKFLVPLNRFTLGEKDDVTTTLTRADFQIAAPSEHTASMEVSTSKPAGVTASTTSVAGESNTVANVSSPRQSQNVAGDATSGTVAVGTLAPARGTADSQATVAADTSMTASTSTKDTSEVPAQADTKVEPAETKSSEGNAAALASTTNETGAASKSDATHAAADTSTAGQEADASVVAKTDEKSQDHVEHKATTPDATANGYASTQVKDDEKALTPTGQTSADQTPAGDPKLITAAQAVREALDNDATTAHADVRVLPENGKISLRGKVNSDSQKSAIESKAQNAANGCEIDSQLRVENQ